MNPINPNYIDIHSHLNFSDYDSDRRLLIDKMNEEKIWTITVGIDFKSSVQAIEICEESDVLFASIGLHPNDEHTEKFEATRFKPLLENEKIVAVGECGLDYFRLGHDEVYEKARQKSMFEDQIQFAVEAGLPLMIHCRNAYDDVFDILSHHKKSHGEKLLGNIHFFAGTVEQAKKFLELDFSLSFTGVITFTNDYDEVISYMPIQSILSETDAPFVAPASNRGKRNDSTYIKEVVKRIAEIRKADFEQIRQALVLNAFRVFSLENHVF